MLSSISVKELLQLGNKVSIIDIRIPTSYNNNHIPGAKNIPKDKLISEPNKYLNRYEKYYIYCQQGMSSMKVCNLLNKQGYNVVDIKGGYEAWVIEK